MPHGLLASLNISSRVNEFGAYAGLAAIVGLGVLSLLYFAQAREVKRLREWAGRAPERSAEIEAAAAQSAQSRMAAHPQANAPASPAAVAPARPTTAVPPAVASTAAAAAAAVRPGGTPATTPVGRTGVPVTPPVSKPGSPAAPGAPATPASATPPAGAPAVPPASAPAGQPTVIIPPVTQSPATTPAVPTPATPAARTPVPRPAAAAPLRAPAPVAYTPTSARAQASAERELGVEERSPLRTTLAVVAGVVAVAALVFILVTQVFGGSSSPAPNRVAGETTATKTTATTKTTKTTATTSTVSRGNVTVAFLNGTRVTGVARGVANKVQRAGYKIGAVTNAVDQTATSTIVYYGDGQRAQAQQVAAVLSLPATAVRPIDQSTRVVAGPDADVVVVVGADQSGA